MFPVLRSWLFRLGGVLAGFVPALFVRLLFVLAPFGLAALSGHRRLTLVHLVSNELVKPLGVERPQPRRLLPARRVRRIIGAMAGVTLFGFIGYVAVIDDPMGGEPHAVVPIGRAPPPPAVQPEAKDKSAALAAPPNRMRATAAELENEAGVAVVRPGGDGAPQSVIIRVPEPTTVKLNPSPDSRLVERTRNGILPRIGADGARAAQVYARPVGSLASGARPAGRIAIVVGGLGISQSATADAIARLPGPVTLAIAPYGADLERTVGKAREEGHEVMLQAPMEPFDYPDNDPGPHTLTVAAKPAENIERLQWLMSRFTGYVGVINFMGARLTADSAALAPILKEIGGRGLLFVDDGSSSRSIAQDVSSGVRMDMGRADMVVDAVARPDAIDKELARLESIARDRGLALASASALPVTVDRIVRWAHNLEAKGILLVPVSSALGGGKG
jgi:uncharacterized protein